MFPGLPTASLTVTDLFSSPFHFSVPHYQRPFSWTTVEAGQLLDDVLAASGAGGDTSAAEPDYFLGAILLLNASGKLPDGREREPRVFEIIDGQQRLVTLAILAAVLRDLGTDKWRWGGRNRLDQLVAADSAATRSTGVRYRIELRAQEQDFLENNVQARGATTTSVAVDDTSLAEERLLAVREHFRKELAALDESERRRLADYVCDQCHFVVVLTSDIDRAHRLFTVLNGRGRTLQRNDILKPELLKDLTPERVDAAIATWDRVSLRLGGSFDNFFSHLFAIYGRPDSKIVESIRQVMAQSGGAEPFLKTVLTPLSEAYYQVCHASDVGLNIDAEARRYLVYLGRLKEGDWAPAAILALHEYKEDPARGTLLLKEIDRLAHLLRMLSLGNSKRKRRFGHVIDLIRSKAPVKPGDGPFHITRDEVRNISYHLRSLYKREQQVCKQLLLRLNDELARSTTLLNPGDYSVEHVLPRRAGAGSEWRRWFPDAEERETCIESIGNLVVVTRKQNERARNQEFARKREIYRGAPDDPPVLAITRDAVEANIWTASEIRERETKFLGLIRDTWGVEVSGLLSARAEAQTLQSVVA